MPSNRALARWLMSTAGNPLPTAHAIEGRRPTPVKKINDTELMIYKSAEPPCCFR
jgi:hypothetical protein